MNKQENERENACLREQVLMVADALGVVVAAAAAAAAGAADAAVAAVAADDAAAADAAAAARTAAENGSDACFATCVAHADME